MMLFSDKPVIMSGYGKCWNFSERKHYGLKKNNTELRELHGNIVLAVYLLNDFPVEDENAEH